MGLSQRQLPSGRNCNIQLEQDERLLGIMRNKATDRGRRTNSISEEVEQMRLYCAAHPSTPSAIRQPHLFRREQLWIALLGPNAEQGIVGIGPSIEAALSNFDAQYLAYLHPSGPASAILPKNEIGNAIRPRTRGNNFNAVG